MQHVEDAAPTRKLAAAVITQSLALAEEGNRYEIAWLASKSAEKWLDLLGIPQSSMLARTEWMTWARTACSRRGFHGECIATGLAYMDNLMERGSAGK